MEKHFLASANSCNGFINFFNNINPNKNGFTYILKGGPGTGKSTIMKNIAKTYKKRGYDIGKYGIDAVFGKDTEKAVKKYQLDNKLKVDVIVGKDTAHSLGWTYRNE